MPPSKPQKYKKPVDTGNSYWDNFFQQQQIAPPYVPPKPVVVPTPPKPVVQYPQPQQQSNPWLPLWNPPAPDRGAPPQPQYNPLPPPPVDIPRYNPLPQNQVQQPPQPQAWRPELIQPMARPDIGAPQIQQTQTYSPTLQSNVNTQQQGPIQGPQPRPSYINPVLPLSDKTPYRYPQAIEAQNVATGSPGQKLTEGLGQVLDPVTGVTGMTPFSQTAAYQKMQNANQQLDDRRPYGTASVWDTWQGITEGAQQIGQGFVDAWNNPSTRPEDKLAGLGKLGANIVGGVSKMIETSRDTAIGYTATAPVVGLVNTSQGLMDYGMTRKPDQKNTVGEYIRSYGGAYLDALSKMVTGGNIQGAIDSASPTLQQFQQAGQLTGTEIKDLANTGDLKRAGEITGLVELNYSNPQAQAETRKQLVDKTVSASNYKSQAEYYMALAAASTDKGDKDSYLEQAALAGYKAYQKSQTNDFDIVNANTTWEQMLIEIAAPDPIFDGVGMLFKGLGLFGDTAKKVFGSPGERRMLQSADDFLKVAPESIAVDIEKLGLSPEIKQVFEPYSKIFTWTKGTSKAQQDAYHLTNAVLGMLSDVDNAHDARMLLNIMSDSKQMSTAIKNGIDYQLFWTKNIRDLADETGKVYLGLAQFADKDVQNALKTWNNLAKDFLQDAKSLKKEQEFNKILFTAELSDSLKTAGYQRYGVWDAAKKTAQKNFANEVSNIARRSLSTFQITLNPGSWVRDIAATAGLAAGDGVFYMGKWRDSLGKIYGDVMPSLLVEEKAMSAANEMGKGVGRLVKPSAKWEEAMANNIWAKSVMDMNKKYIPKTLNETLAPVLKQAGVEQRTVNVIVNQLSHTLQTEGKAAMFKQFNSLMAGMERPFDLKQYAAQIDNVLTVDELGGIYKAVQTAKTPEEFQSRLDDILNKAQSRYAQRTIDSPISPQRYDWTDIELTKDAGEYAQAVDIAVKNGLDPAVAKVATQEAVAAAEKEKGLLDTLVQFITDSQDPNARYALYNVWAQRQELLLNTRVHLSEMAEDVLAKGGKELWATEYFPAAKQLWTETRTRIETVISDAKRLLNEGADLSPHYSAWGQLERTARQDEAKLFQSLALNPQSAKYDKAMMQEVIAAKRAIEDRAAARAYASARRVIGEMPQSTTDVMDVLVAADRDINVAGAKVRAYLDKTRDRLMGENGVLSAKAWEQYFSIRNAKWKEHTEYAVARWRNAETQTTLYGKGTGLTWADAFTSAPKGKKVAQYNDTLELIGQSSKEGFWWVRRPDGSHLLMPDSTVKTAQAMVPDEIISKYKGTYAGTELATESELDNIMSGTVVFDNASAVDMAKAEQEAAKVARDSMRAEWDRIAKAEYGLPGIDQMIATYKRQGVINIGEGKKFENLYGNTIAGMKIENSSDVERFLGSYSQLSKKGKKAKATKLEQTVMAVEDMPPLWKFDDPNYIPPAGVTKQGVEDVVAMMEQALIEQSQKVGKAGATVAPNMGHMSTQGIEEVNRLRQQLVNAYNDYVKIQPNKLTEAAQLEAYRIFRTQIAPQVDNVLNAAADYGNKMRSFVVPDRLNQTRMDDLLGLVMPYHFWFTRTLKNSIERMVYEPSLFRRINQLQEDLPQLASSIAGQPQDPNMPARYQGAVPIKIGDKQYYAYLDLGQFWPNSISMLANKFSTPDSSEGMMQYALESMQSMGFGVYPFLADGIGLASGAKNPQDVRPLGYFPLGRALSWEAANIFGIQNVPSALRPGNAEYIIGRQISNMAQRGDITPTEAQFAQDYLRQAYGGEKALPEQSRLVPDARMQEIINQATQAATEENRTKHLTSMSGVSATLYDTTESNILAAQNQYFGSQYTPNNMYGGKTASKEVLADNPGVQSRWAQKSITDLSKERPGIGASKQAMYADQKDLKDSLTQAGSSAVDIAIGNNPSITKKDMYQARLNGMLQYATKLLGSDAVQTFLATTKDPTTGDVSKFVVDSLIGKNYPSVYNANQTYAPNMYTQSATMPTGGQPPDERKSAQQQVFDERTKGMNPVEQADFQEQQAIDYATYNFPDKPVYVKGDKTYGDQLDAWEKQRTDWLSQQLGVSNEEASQLLTEAENKNKTDAQVKREKAIDDEFAYREAQWQAKRESVVGEFGNDAGALWDSYYGLPKGDKRKAYLSEHPELKIYNMLAWNPDQYAEAKSLFGEDAWMEWAKVPKWEDTEESKAARAAYFEEHPTAKVLHAWVNGRPANYGNQDEDNLEFKYNFGKDFNEAMGLFGEDIWQVFGAYKSSWDKYTKRAFFSAHETFSDFLTWWYGGEKKESTSRGGGRSGGGGGGGGYRSSNYIPNTDRWPQIYSQGLSQGLAAVQSPDSWRPTWINMSGLRPPAVDIPKWRPLPRNMRG